jgi:glycosyltransferase involved in cell wall biosynthesis
LAPTEAIPGLVSVIMPTFNHQAFVARAMRSVFDQTYRDVEFLIVDDDSSDATFKIIRDLAKAPRFSRRFRRLEINRNQRNLGAHATLNLGIAAARGEFVTFINSDDCYEPERLRLLTAHATKADTPYLAFSAVKLIDAAGSPVSHHELKSVLELGPARLAATLPTISFGFLRYQLTGSTGNIFTNHALLNEIGGFSPLAYCHDWEFMLRAITVAEPYYVPETAYHYRIHTANTFGSLQYLAVADTTATLASYYRRVADGRVRNRKAPTPMNWPYIFERFARQFGVYEAWQQEAHYRPHYAVRQLATHDPTDDSRERDWLRR